MATQVTVGAAPFGVVSKQRPMCSARVMRSCGGFTYMELVLAIIIVGIGVAALVPLFGLASKSNKAASDTIIAMGLADNILELMETASYRDSRYGGKSDTKWGLESGETLLTAQSAKTLDIADFDGSVFSSSSTIPGPIDANFAVVTGCSQYSQKVFVYKLDPTKLAGAALADTAADVGVRKVVVEIWYQATPAATSVKVYTITFLRFDESLLN